MQQVLALLARRPLPNHSYHLEIPFADPSLSWYYYIHYNGSSPTEYSSTIGTVPGSTFSDSCVLPIGSQNMKTHHATIHD